MTRTRQTAFDTIINALTTEPVLHMFDDSKDIVIQADASVLEIGGVLLQKQGDLTMPVKYVSRKLLKREQAYSTVEKECLAVVWTVRQLYKYIYRREFTLQTDHLPLVCIGQKKVANERIMRWALMLQEQ